MDVIAMVMEVMDIVKDQSCNALDRRDSEGDRHCYRIKAAMYVIDAIAMVMDIVIGFKL